MYLKYGSYTHAANEAEIKITRDTNNRDSQGRLVKMTERWQIDGELQAASQSAITTAIDALIAAYSSDNSDLILYLDDGTTESSHTLKRADAISGPRVVQRPSFPTGRGAEYATFRTYSIAVEADFAGDSSVGLVSWMETLEFFGGGERWAYLETLNGAPQRQTLAQQTTYHVTQRGEAVGLLAYPSVQGPIWPSQEHTDQRRITRSVPDKVGPSRFENWKVSWEYHFESPSQLAGNPALWNKG